MMRNSLSLFVILLFDFYFVLCWLFIGFVSSFDALLTIRFQESLEDYEQNPLARLLLKTDNWQVANFVGMKMFLTIFVLGLLICIHRINIKYGLAIATALAIFQAGLLYYLNNW